MCAVPRAPPNHGTPVADYFSCASCNGGLENERAKVVEKMALIKFLLVYILQVGFCLFPDGWDPVVAVNCALILASHPFFANFCGSRPGLPDFSPWFSAADALPSSRKQPNSARRSARVARRGNVSRGGGRRLWGGNFSKMAPDFRDPANVTSCPFPRV